jgi:hypothetical protein
MPIKNAEKRSSRGSAQVSAGPARGRSKPCRCEAGPRTTHGLRLAVSDGRRGGRGSSVNDPLCKQQSLQIRAASALRRERMIQRAFCLSTALCASCPRFQTCADRDIYETRSTARAEGRRGVREQDATAGRVRRREGRSSGWGWVRSRSRYLVSALGCRFPICGSGAMLACVSGAPARHRSGVAASRGVQGDDIATKKAGRRNGPPLTTQKYVM